MMLTPSVVGVFDTARQMHQEADARQEAIVDLLATSAKDQVRTQLRVAKHIQAIQDLHAALVSFYTPTPATPTLTTSTLTTSTPATPATPATLTTLTTLGTTLTTHNTPTALGTTPNTPGTTAHTQSARDAELHALAVGTDSKVPLFEFDARLRAVADYHRRFPDEPTSTPLDADADADIDSSIDSFSGAEAHGRLLDLHRPFQSFVNLPHAAKSTYLAFLAEVDNFTALSPQTRSTPEYRTYLASLDSYLVSFFTRARPLFNVEKLGEDAVAEFDTLWATGVYAADMPLDGPAHLFCIACQKQFTNSNVYNAHLSGKKHIKASSNPPPTVVDPDVARTAHMAHRQLDAKALAFSEFLVQKYMEALGDAREETRMDIERKQALTSKERRDEPMNIEIDSSDSDDEDDETPKFHNPLKLPLGWDGKPIPYWLFKLHGLGVEYPCEICGNYVYMGRKAFDRHFSEWRHSYGLKCLGIPSTKEFWDVIKIDDAVALWNRSKGAAAGGVGASGGANGGEVEELEDAEGNVYNRKTWEDLKRQGLI